MSASSHGSKLRVRVFLAPYHSVRIAYIPGPGEADTLNSAKLQSESVEEYTKPLDVVALPASAPKICNSSRTLLKSAGEFANDPSLSEVVLIKLFLVSANCSAGSSRHSGRSFREKFRSNLLAIASLSAFACEGSETPASYTAFSSYTCPFEMQ